MLKKGVANEKCENLKFATPPMGSVDFRGPEGPRLELLGLNVDYFLSSRKQHDFSIDFEPKRGSILSPPGSFFGLLRGSWDPLRKAWATEGSQASF